MRKELVVIIERDDVPENLLKWFEDQDIYFHGEDKVVHAWESHDREVWAWLKEEEMVTEHDTSIRLICTE